jgi:hypothetical protein
VRESHNIAHFRESHNIAQVRGSHNIGHVRESHNIAHVRESHNIAHVRESHNINQVNRLHNLAEQTQLVSMLIFSKTFTLAYIGTAQNRYLRASGIEHCEGEFQEMLSGPVCFQLQYDRRQ